MSRGHRNTSRQETKENFSEFVDHNIFQSALRSAGGGEEKLWTENPVTTRRRGLFRILGATIVSGIALTWGANTLSDVADGLECYGDQTVILESGDSLTAIAREEVEGSAFEGSVAGYIAEINDITDPNKIPSSGELEVPEFCEKF